MLRIWKNKWIKIGYISLVLRIWKNKSMDFQILNPILSALIKICEIYFSGIYIIHPLIWGEIKLMFFSINYDVIY